MAPLSRQATPSKLLFDAAGSTCSLRVRVLPRHVSGAATTQAVLRSRRVRALSASSPTRTRTERPADSRLPPVGAALPPCVSRRARYPERVQARSEGLVRTSVQQTARESRTRVRRAILRNPDPVRGARGFGG